MRVLVTGCGGFIGTPLQRVLAERGVEVVGYDHPSDVRNRQDVFAAVARVDAVINLAGVLGSERFDQQHLSVEVNILGALNIYDAAAAAGVPVVQIGTGHKGFPNPYALTKACAEDLGLARVRFGAERIVIVRAYHAYGPGQKHGPGHAQKIVPSMVCAALHGDPVVVNGTGEQRVDLVHVDDVALALADALTAPAGTVIEAGTGKPTSVLDAARTIIEATGSSSTILHAPMRIGEPPESTVVASAPACPNPWPHRLAETVDSYRRPR